MRKSLGLFSLALLLAVLACTAEQREMLGRYAASHSQNSNTLGPTQVAAQPADSAPVRATDTPAFSEIALPTPAPTMGGPLGTLTAIAGLFATAEPDRTPYEIVNRGKPHFIEFHAWW